MLFGNNNLKMHIYHALRNSSVKLATFILFWSKKIYDLINILCRCPESACPGHCLPVDCLNYTSDWKCDKCAKILTADEAIDITENVQKLYKLGGNGIENLEKNEKITKTLKYVV